MLLAIDAGFRWLEDTAPQHSRNDDRKPEVAGYHPGGYSCDPAAIGPFRLGENLSDTSACKDAREEHRLKADDLLQQTRSADAAEAVVGLSYKQAKLAIIGLVFAFLTLCAAVAAAIGAGVAAVAAKKAVVATREIAEVQLRPWLTFSEVNIEPTFTAAVVLGGPLPLRVRAKIVNSGSVAANGVRVWVVMCSWEEVSENYNRILAGERVGQGFVHGGGPLVLAPNGVEQLEVTPVFSMERLPDPSIKNLEMSVYFVTKYRSISTNNGSNGKDNEYITTQIYDLVDKENPTQSLDLESVAAGTRIFGARQNGGHAA